MNEIYAPSDDSYLFVDFLREYFLGLKDNEIKYLDMGTGSGILAETASEFLSKKNILAVDINPESVKLLKKNGFNVVESDLFSKIEDKFDLITFNAPYLPEGEEEPEESKTITTGGRKGDEVALEFLKQAKEHLKEEGKIFLLISSLTPIKRIKKFKPKIVARKKIFFEELLILEFSFS